METKDAITEVLKKIEENPFIFNTESDIRSLLFRELCYRYPKMVDIKLASPTGSHYQTNLVHTEYRFGNGTGMRLDTVVFDEQDASNINDVWFTTGLTETHYISVLLKDAIEIKVDLGIWGSERRKLIQKDIDKLIRLKDMKRCQNIYFLYICRWLTDKTEKKDETYDIIKNIRSEYENKKGFKFYPMLLPKSHWQ